MNFGKRVNIHNISAIKFLKYSRFMRTNCRGMEIKFFADFTYGLTLHQVLNYFEFLWRQPVKRIKRFIS